MMESQRSYIKRDEQTEDEKVDNKRVLSYCLKCKADVESKNPEGRRICNRMIIIFFKICCV